jgi:putative spermidine/putrescine transport system permease protein
MTLGGFLLRAICVAVFVFLLAPLMMVVAVSFSPSSDFNINLSGVSLRWFKSFFASPTFVRALFVVSLPVALATAVIATAIGCLGAVGIVRFSFHGRDLLETVFMVPMFIPNILLGVALYLFYRRIGLAGSFGGLIIGHVLLALPYVLRVVGAGLAGVNPALEDAAVSLGCNRPQAFMRVTVPVLRSTLLAAAIFAFIISFSDVNLSLFVSGPNTTNLPVHIYSQIIWQGDPIVAAASSIQILLVCSIIWIAQRFLRIRLVF